MLNDTGIKVRLWIVGSLLLLIYPLILIVVVTQYIYETFMKKKVPKSIAGEVAVITGAAGGLGKCVAAELAAEGCHVAICDINYAQAETTAKEIANKYGVNAKAYQLDVTKHKEIEEVNEQLKKDIGTATILVNNAGVLLHSDQLNPSVEELQLMVNVNYLSHFFTNRVFLKNMKQAKKGHLVAISSASGLLTLPFSEPYCSCKTAVRTIMRTLRVELLLENFNNIDCTTVFPYFLKTHAGVQQLVAESGFIDMYPLLNGEDVAKRIVQGMLCREVEIALPGFFMLIYRLISLLPAKAQDWMLYWHMNRTNIYSRMIESLKKK